jgi:proline iminopeptidase
MAWRVLGDPREAAWVLLHGGPGSGAGPALARPFDAARSFLVLPDQRGAGASRPRGVIRGNHTSALVADLEALRSHLGLDRWSVLGGSWGSVLALAYAQAHPHRVQRLVLRGAFALSRREIGGLLMPVGGAAAGVLGAGVARGSLPALLARLAQLLQSATPDVTALDALRRWQDLESGAAVHGMRRSLRQALRDRAPARASAIRATLAAQQRQQRRQRATWGNPRRGPVERALWRKFRIQTHYLRHRGFVRPAGLDRAVLALARAGVAVDWVHGTCDAVCPPANSRRWAALGRRVPQAPVRLHQPASGHLGHEPAMLARLRQVVGAAA